MNAAPRWSTSVYATLHFEAQVVERRLDRTALLRQVAALADRLTPYEGCRLALDLGRLGKAVVLVEFGDIWLLTALAPGQAVIHPDTLHVHCH